MDDTNGNSRALALRALDLATPASVEPGLSDAAVVALFGPGSPVAALLPLAAHAEGVLSRMAQHNREIVRALEAEQTRVQREDKAEWDCMLAHLVARAESAGLSLTWEQKDIVDNIARLGEAWATRVRTLTDGDLDGVRDTYRGYVTGYGDTLRFAAHVSDRLAAACRASIARCPELLDRAEIHAPDEDLGVLFPLRNGQESDALLAERMERVGITPATDADARTGRPSQRPFGAHEPPDLAACPPSQARALAAELGLHPWWVLTMHACCRDAPGTALGSGAAAALTVPDPCRPAPPISLVGAHSVPFVASREDHLPAVWWELRNQRMANRPPPPLLPCYEIMRRADPGLAAELDTPDGRRGLSVAAKRVAALLDTPEAAPVRDVLCVLYPDERDWFVGGRAPAGHEWLRPWPPCFTGWLSALYRTTTAKTTKVSTTGAAPATVQIPASALVFIAPEPPQDWQRGWLPSEVELTRRHNPDTNAGELRAAWMSARLAP